MKTAPGLVKFYATEFMPSLDNNKGKNVEEENGRDV